MKQTPILGLLWLSSIAFASPFAEVETKNIIPAKHGFYDCGLYDDEHRFVSSVGWKSLFFDDQYFDQKSQKGLFEMGNNEIWQAIYQSSTARLIFQRTSTAQMNDQGIRRFTVKMTYTHNNARAKNYTGSFDVECGP